MYIYMYVYVCMYIYMYVYICLYIYVYIYIYVCVSVYVCVFVYIHPWAMWTTQGILGKWSTFMFWIYMDIPWGKCLQKDAEKPCGTPFGKWSIYKWWDFHIGLLVSKRFFMLNAMFFIPWICFKTPFYPIFSGKKKASTLR